MLATERVFPLIASISNTFEKDKYFKKLAGLLSVSETLLKASVSRFHSPNSKKFTTKNKVNSTVFNRPSTDALEEHTLVLLIHHPDFRTLTKELFEDHFENFENRAIFAKLTTCSTMNELKEKIDPEIQSHLHIILAKEIPPSSTLDLQKDYIVCARRLEERKLRQLLIANTELQKGEQDSPEQNLRSANLTKQLRNLFKDAAGSQKKNKRI